jgi:homoserine dehydrogenase
MQLTVGIGLLGCGTVGAHVARRLLHERDAIERRSGVRYELRGIAVRDFEKPRPSDIDAGLLTRDARSVVEDPLVDLVVECIGGISEAAEFVERALDRGRHVVTANKNLLATQGPRLQALASSRNASLRYEASACGAIPIVRTIDDALAGDQVLSFAGVVNGTCNAILSAMESGADYVDALAEAQRLGYAEAVPSSDIEGTDAAHKLALLMQLAFGLAVISPRIRREGIIHVTKRAIARATMLGYRIRLVAAALRTEDGAAAEVAPVLLPYDHPFAQATGPDNVVRLVGRDAGPLLLSGHGAGGAATASAVLGDVVTSLRAIGERHDLGRRIRTHALRPAIDVTPFFAALPRHPELPRYPLWDDTVLNAPAAQIPAFSWPGKELLS